MREYNKLVRDKIPEIISNNGENPKTRILDNIEYKKELLNRLEEIAYKHDISTNKLIIKCIEYALENMEEDKENSN